MAWLPPLLGQSEDLPSFFYMPTTLKKHSVVQYGANSQTNQESRRPPGPGFQRVYPTTGDIAIKLFYH